MDLEKAFGYENFDPYEKQMDRWPHLYPLRKPDLLDDHLQTDHVEVKDSGKTGQGLFARRLFKPNHEVFIFYGKKEMEDYENGFLPSAYLNLNSVVVGREEKDSRRSFGKFVYCTPDDKSALRYLNHSCKPNLARTKKDPFSFRALHEIQPGEELTADYSLLETNPEWSMRCNCGAKECRHLIQAITFLPLERLAAEWHHIPRVMQEWAMEESIYSEIQKLVQEKGVTATIIEFEKKFVDKFKD